MTCDIWHLGHVFTAWFQVLPGLSGSSGGVNRWSHWLWWQWRCNKRRLSSWSGRISSGSQKRASWSLLILKWLQEMRIIDHYGFTNNSDYGFYSHPKKSFASLLVEISTLKIAQIRGSHISSCTISQTWTSEMPAASCPMICWGPSCLVDNWWSGDLFTLPVSQHGTVANLIWLWFNTYTYHF